MQNPRFSALALGAAVLLAGCAQNAPMKQEPDAFKAGQAPNQAPQVVSAPPPLPTLVLIAPTDLRSGPVIAPGCWVKLFDDANFQGRDSLTLAGPVSLPDIHSPAGKVYWPHRVRSILVGPRARLTAYGARDFGNPLATLVPGTEQVQLEGALATTPQIASMKLECT